MMSADGYEAEPASLERFLAQYQEKAGPTMPSPPPAPPARADKPAPIIAAVPRPVPAPPRAEPSLRVDSPRVDAVPRPEPLPRLTAVPKPEPPRVDVAPKLDVAPPKAEPFIQPPRAEFTPRIDAEPAATFEPVTPFEAPPDADSSRFDLTPRTDFSTGFDFATEPEEEESDMPQPKSRAGASRRTTAIAAAVVLVALTGGGMFAARRYALAGGGAGETGTLTVTSNPTGAQVLVDRESKGVTPTTVTLTAGTHAVELRGVGEPRTISVAVTAGAQLSQYIELAATNSSMGRLQVRTEPAGAMVTIDALPRGNSPITIGNLDPGEHSVVLSNDSGIGHPVGDDRSRRHRVAQRADRGARGLAAVGLDCDRVTDRCPALRGRPAARQQPERPHHGRDRRNTRWTSSTRRSATA